jgi:hypothetical protein
VAGRGDEEHHGEDGGRPELLNGELHINYYTRFYQQIHQISLLGSEHVPAERVSLQLVLGGHSFGLGPLSPTAVDQVDQAGS